METLALAPNRVKPKLERLCKHGHPLTGKNVGHKQGTRYCRTCVAIRHRAWRLNQQRERRDERLRDYHATLDDLALMAEFGIVLALDASEELRCWAMRKVRERAGLPLGEDERWQASRQLSDL